MKTLLRITAFSLLTVVLLFVGIWAYVQYGLVPPVPEVNDKSALQWERIAHQDSLWTIHQNWLKRNDSGIWEEYVTGTPFTRGVVLGKLNKELMHEQEAAFAEQIHQLVPSNIYLRFLGFFTRIFNRNLAEHITPEYQQEIYAESLFAPEEFNYIGEPYDRMLNYHAAHDIGHALQSLALVGCTSFATWNEFSSDSSLLIGRNFDFYSGDRFAENKLILFVKPTEGIPFAIYTWAGFVGCASGMNLAGLTVTINAAKSDIPTGSATPISLLAREILQYATTIDEAFAIAQKRNTFVSESILIGSAKERKAAIIEKSPTKIALFPANQNYLQCANHYQSATFQYDPNNVNNIKESASSYRFGRLSELLAQNPKIDYKKAAVILRDQRGLGDKNIGYGNEKAMNQLIAHHSVIFQPEKRLMWVSTAPYQLGKYLCYDLNKVFSKAENITKNETLYEVDFTIEADSFLYSNDWLNFLTYRQLKQQIKQHIKAQNFSIDEQIPQIIAANPEYWESYFWAAEYERAQGNKQRAFTYYKQALSKEINTQSEVENIKKAIEKIDR